MVGVGELKSTIDNPKSTIRVTGFGPFGTTNENPSAWLAERSGVQCSVIPVTFAAVDAELERLAQEDWDILLMLGLASKSPTLRFETVAHNHIGPGADMAGVVWGPGPIDPAAPAQLHATLWSGLGAETETPERAATTDAGGYLCNYILFRALQLFPSKPVGFLHVAEPSLMGLDDQLVHLKEILQVLATPQTETEWSRWLPL